MHDKKDLRGTILNIANVIVNSNDNVPRDSELYKELNEYKTDLHMFDSLICSKRFEMEYIVKDILNIDSNDDSLLVENYVNGNLEHFFDIYFDKYEGMSCSGDKTAFTIKSILMSLKKNTNIELYSEYEGKDKGKQAYWSPKTIKDTNQAIALFSDWFYNI